MMKSQPKPRKQRTPDSRQIEKGVTFKQVGSTKPIPIIYKEVTYFCLSQLMPNKLVNKLNILIKLVDWDTKKVDHVWGSCKPFILWDPKEIDFTYRNFIIKLNRNIPNLFYRIQVLAHELTHVKQYAKGELYGGNQWKGSIHADYSHSHNSYNDAPWERNAILWERKLTDQFIDQLPDSTNKTILKKQQARARMAEW